MANEVNDPFAAFHASEPPTAAAPTEKKKRGRKPGVRIASTSEPPTDPDSKQPEPNVLSIFMHLRDQLAPLPAAMRKDILTALGKDFK